MRHIRIILILCLPALAACDAGGLRPDRDSPFAPGVSSRATDDSVDGLIVGHRLMAAGEYELALRAYYRAAVDQGEDAGLFPLQELLHQDAFAAVAVALFLHDGVDRLARLFQIMADVDAFAGGQAFGFDHLRPSRAALQVALGLPRTVEGA